MSTIREKMKEQFWTRPTIASNASTYQHYSECKASKAERDLRARTYRCSEILSRRDSVSHHSSLADSNEWRKRKTKKEKNVKKRTYTRKWYEMCGQNTYTRATMRAIKASRLTDDFHRTIYFFIFIARLRSFLVQSNVHSNIYVFA